MEEDKHITYQEYQKKSGKKNNDNIAIFVSAFFILLLLFLGIAKQISPEIDVSIGEEETTSELDKNNVDERLKLLQEEDKGSMFADELEEKVVIPEQKQKDDTNVKEEEPIAEKEATPKPAETASPAPKITEQNVPSKVVVGYYNTKEQAEVAKGIIAESGLNITPFVRAIGGAYTIQVGSYNSREKAQNLVNELLRNNYPARIISE